MAGRPSVGGFIGFKRDLSPVHTLIQVMFSGAGHLCPHPQPGFFSWFTCCGNYLAWRFVSVEFLSK